MSFTEVSSLMPCDHSEQMYCSCCQNTFVWEDEGAEAIHAALTCGHLFCSDCMKSQWLDVGSHEHSVFCLICSKRVGILHLGSTRKKACKSQIVSNPTSLPNKVEEVEEEQDDGEWSTEQKEGLPLQEWVNTNMCDNLVLKLVSTGTDEYAARSALVLGENSSDLSSGLMVQSNSNLSQSDHSVSPAEQDHSSQTEETLMGYIVNTSGSENILVNATYPNSSEGVTVQANMIGSPDLNLKALLQMLEKNSDLTTATGNRVENHEAPLDQEEGKINDAENDGTESEGQYTDVCNTATLDLEMLSMSDKQRCNLIGVEDEWQPVGIVQEGPTLSDKDKTHSDVPCALYVQNANVMSMDECGNYVCLEDGQEQNQTVHEAGRLNNVHPQHAWLSHVNRNFPRKGNPRPRRGRRRKPFLRHFQSEFFMRPYLKRERSPQLQLVKLVRQRAQDRLQEEERLAKATAAQDEKYTSGIDVEKRSLDNPELAFMKTVDMPSGKRVEDIYVVPSVWISNEKKNAGKPICSRESLNVAAANLCNYFPVGAHQGSRASYISTSAGPYFRQLQNTFSHCQSGPPPSVQIPTRKTLYQSSTCDSHTFRPTHSMYKVIRGHIITTLNAPKLEPVPTLKDLCKAALGLKPNASFQHMNENNNLVLVNGNLQNNYSLPESSSQNKEPSVEIKTPKEFLDMQGAAAHHELKFPEVKFENRNLKNQCGEDDIDDGTLHEEQPLTNMQDICSLQHSVEEDNEGSFDICDNQASNKMSDTEETLPENPLFTEDIKVERGKPLAKMSDSSELLQAKVSDITKLEPSYSSLQSQDYMARVTFANLKENPRPQILNHNSTAGLKPTSSDYVIPIVSYKVPDSARANYLPSASSDQRHLDCSYPKPNGGHQNLGMRSFSNSSYPTNSCALFSDESYLDEANEDNIASVPSLVTITKQIKCLSSFEPLNKPLANLAAALNLLCNAEKTLCDSNFIIYRQLKWDNNSKLGRLNICIRKIGDSLISVGKTLQAWTKETSSRCFKTMGVLTDLYNSNILALIELITPYFHYICELIASCHSDSVHWNKQIVSVGDPPPCMAESLQVKSGLKWPEASSGNISASYSKPLNNFLYADPTKHLSPKDLARHHDHEQSVSSEEIGEVESETSVSGQTSRKTSPKVKPVAIAKRGRPLGSKNGQRKARICLPKSKTKQQPSPPGCKRYFSQDMKYTNTSSMSHPGMQLPNTILVNMSAEKFWNEANATIFHRPPMETAHSIPANVNSENVNFNTASHPMLHLPTGTATWMLPTENSHPTVPGHFDISQGSDGTKLPLLNPELNAHEENQGSMEELEGTNSDCSPGKKVKLEQQDLPSSSSAYSNIVFALPRGINIVLGEPPPTDAGVGEDNGTTTAAPLPESASVLTPCAADTQNYQNIFFIQGCENVDSYLQLDPQQLSAALLNTFKDNKDVQKRFELALMQQCPSVDTKGDQGTGAMEQGEEPKLNEMENDVGEDMDDLSGFTNDVHIKENILDI